LGGKLCDAPRPRSVETLADVDACRAATGAAAVMSSEALARECLLFVRLFVR